MHKPLLYSAVDFLSIQLTYLIGAVIHHFALAFKTDETTCVLIGVIMLDLQREKLFTWKIDKTRTALTAQRHVEIHHRSLYP
ncbi:MAG: hypothetical protein ACYTGS_11595 [Planctomycetota bacterium]